VLLIYTANSKGMTTASTLPVIME